MMIDGQSITARVCAALLSDKSEMLATRRRADDRLSALRQFRSWTGKLAFHFGRAPQSDRC